MRYTRQDVDMALRPDEVPQQPDEYDMGPGTLRVSRKALHGELRLRLVKRMQALTDTPGVVLLKGGSALQVGTSDAPLLFRQEHFFFYMFGVEEEDWFGTVDLRTGAATLFMPRLPLEHTVWLGPLQTPDEVKATYAVDAVHYVDEMPEVLAQLSAPCLHLLHGTNTDSGLTTTPTTFDGMEEHTLEKDLLYNALTQCRVIKTAQEIRILAYANKIGSAGHVAAMQAARPGMMEYQIESTYNHHCYYHGGQRHSFYTPIVASATNSRVLHYGHSAAPNARRLRDGDWLLLDVGSEYYHYGSDITTTWPVNGKFENADHRAVYETVLRAQNAVKAAMGPGVLWPHMQRLAYEIILQGLAALNIVTGDVYEMMEKGVGALFMPHGLGHFMGMQVHDVGGYAPGAPPRLERPGYCYLRTARELEPGMVITCEPGCYFIPALLRPALEDPVHSEYLVASRVRELLECRHFSGVRIEDNMVVGMDGAYSLTHVPRTPEDIERVMDGAAWPFN